MPGDFAAAFDSLKGVFAKSAKRLAVKADSGKEYTLVTKSPSPFPQHKGEPMWFGSVRLGKAYVSFHLMPLYMDPVLAKTISEALQKRMQGKTCFNFKAVPDKESLADLKKLTEASLDRWSERGWL